MCVAQCYHHANWPLFRNILDFALPPQGPVDSPADLDQATTTFTQAVQRATNEAIPVITTNQNRLTLPSSLTQIMKLKNYYRHRFQRSRTPTSYRIYRLFARVFSSRLSAHRNHKWTCFLKTLHPQAPKFWKVTRYFTRPQSSTPPLYH